MAQGVWLPPVPVPAPVPVPVLLPFSSRWFPFALELSSPRAAFEPLGKSFSRSARTAILPTGVAMTL